MVLILLGVAFYVLVGFGKNRRQQIIQEITLEDLSLLWTKEGSKTIHIGDLSPLWRDNDLLDKQVDDSPKLTNSRAALFYDQYINRGAWFQKAQLQKTVCGGILKLLDQEGNCPSVVNINTDVEGGWDDNTFQILAKTTLIDHSLNVAKQAVRLLSEADAGHVIPDTLVAALGHDLGKLESVRGYLYSLGDHPLAAGRPLAEVQGFNDLSKKDEIIRAIKMHHKMPEGLLGKTLKKADQLARQKELEEQVSRVASVATKDKTAAAWQAQEDIYEDESTESKTATGTPKFLNISAWFDAENFLQELKPYINKIFGNRFMAFSMPDGHVYFQVKVLEEVARKQAKKAGCVEVATMAPKDLTMRQVLFTIVHHLRVDHDVIARGLIKDNFFGGYFHVSRKNGKNIKGYYTPFHAESFGSISEMEHAKPALLRNLVKVAPFIEGQEQG